ncbi:unnamed protein product [Kuraishia capsulata CBS 1993]|uniref:Ras-GAP domain-containing protein n=1 Tax=Kuraishia capsulata CBS 1993 TaxID=1382522 RepID=W6MRB1_9ASCO|nr:uncharacterized protein KUCA_T00004888001 [Kuraishia capsulata CBS 1993]CDK28903.1 unnamed protein product [Kuraishia capsulata CBS 1993]
MLAGKLQREPVPTVGPRDSIVGAIYTRLEQLLPLNSGLNTKQMQMDKHYIQSRNALLTLADTDTFEDCVICTTQVLEAINKKSKMEPLKKRSETSLWSTFIVLRLLSDIADHRWNNLSTSNASLLLDHDSQLSDHVGSLGGRVGAMKTNRYHSVRPPQLSEELVKMALAMVTNLKSKGIVYAEIARITGQKRNRGTSQSETDSLVEDIEACCNNIILYFSGSNPLQYREFVLAKLKSLAIPMPDDYVAHLDLLEVSFVDDSYLHVYLRNCRTVYETAKRPIDQQLVLVFMCRTLLRWMLADPEEYLSISSSPITAAIEFFDVVLKTADLNLYRKSVTMFFATMLLLCPSYFENYGEKYKKMVETKSFDYKTSFVSELRLICSRYPEAGDGLIQVLLVGSTVSIIAPEHPVAVYARNTAPIAYKDLKVDQPAYYPVDVDTELIDNLRINCFCALAGLNTKDSAVKALGLFKDKNTHIGLIRTICGGVSTLIDIHFMLPHIYSYLKEAAPLYRQILCSTAEALRHIRSDELNDAESIDSQGASSSVMDLKEALAQQMNNVVLTATNQSVPSVVSSGTESKRSAVSSGNREPSVSAKQISHQQTTSSSQQTQHELSKEVSHASSSASGSSGSHQVTNSTSPEPHHQSSTFKNLYRSKMLTKNFFRGNSSGSSPLSPNVPSVSPKSPSHAHKHVSTTSSSASATSGTASTSSVSGQLMDKHDAPVKFAKRTIDESQTMQDLVVDLLYFFEKLPHLFLVDPDMPFFHADGTHNEQSVLWLRSAFSSISLLLVDDDERVISHIARFLMSFLKRTWGDPGTQDDPKAGCEQFSASFLIISGLMDLLSTTELSVLKRDQILDFVLKFFDRRKDVFTSESPRLALLSSHGFHKNGQCRPYLMAWEESFLLLLFVDSHDSYKMARKGIEYFINETEFSWHTSKCSEGFEIDLYRAILSDRISASGAAMRKKLRDHLTKSKRPNQSIIYVWRTMYDRWMKSPVGPEKGNDTYGADYPGFLASWGGVFLSQCFKDHPEREELASKYERFISFQINSLKLDDLRLREKAREVLSVGLHPYAVPLVAKDIQAHLDGMPKLLTEKDFVFFDLLISVMKHVLSLDVMALYPYENDIAQILKSMSISLDDQPREAAVLKSRIKFLFLAGVFMSKAPELGFLGDLAGRNKIARLLADWLEDSFFRNEDEGEKVNPRSMVFDLKTTEKPRKVEDRKKQSDMDHLYFDFAVETARVLALCLRGLVLDVPHANFQPEDLNNSLEVSFRNYSNLFVRILEKANDPTKNVSESPAAKHRVNILVNHVVEALIDLLKANVRIGLKFVLPLCYHGQSHYLRYSFINVLANIMDHDNLDIYGQLNNRVVSELNRGFNVFSSTPAMFVAVAQSCPMAEVDTLAAAFLSMTDNESFTQYIMGLLVRVDILQASDSVQILRSNTVATRMIALYSNATAGKYLVRVLYPILQNIIERGKHFEVEKKTWNDENAQEDLDNFLELLTALVNAICDSAEFMPSGLKAICASVYSATGEAFPESKIVAVGAFVFLRLFSPAIVTPERADIAARVVEPAVKRSMIQLARVLQLMANDSLSSLKWPLLKDQTDVLVQLQKKVEVFLYQISQETATTTQVMPSEDIQYSLHLHGYFHRFFYDHFEDIRYNLFHPATPDSLSVADRINIWSNLDHVLSIIGLPKIQKGFSIPDSIRDDTSPQGAHLYDFMSKFSANEAELPPDQSFLSETLTRDGTPVVIMVYDKIPEDMDVQVVCYRIFQFLCKVWESKFHMFVDCTRYHSSNIHATLMKLVTSFYPEKYRNNLEKYIFFNVSQSYSHSLKEYMTAAQETGFFVQTEYYFINSHDDPKVYAQLGLPPYHSPVSSDCKVTFTDVKYWQESVGRFVPVTLKIGTQYLQVLFNTKMTVKARKSMKSFQLLDVHRIEDFSSVDITTTTGVANEVTVVDQRYEEPLILCSPRRIEIMRTIYFSKSKRSPAADVDFENKGSVEFYAGALLNIAFLGLISHHDDIRGSSFKLLFSVGKTFHMDFGRHVEAVTDLSFPARNDGYVFLISQALSLDKPELTYSFLDSFFLALEHSAIESKPSVVYYASPWLRNIYKYVFRANEEYGIERTADLIKKFVSTSRKYEAIKISFSQYIWAQLSLEDNLVDMIIDETITAAIDLEAEGNDWEDIVSLWPLASTLEIFGSLVSRIHEKSRMKILKGNSIVESHTNWMEITILVKLMAFLMFDSLIFAEKYLGDIFYIISVFLDVGPLELRKTLHRLTVKTMHALLSKPDLSPKNHTDIVNLIEVLNGARFKMLFGLNRDDSHADMLMNIGSDMVAKAAAMESFCDLIFSLPDMITSSTHKTLWLVRWNAQTVQSAFLDNSLLQGRALLVLGNLAKRGIDNYSVIQYLKYISKVLRSILERKDHLNDQLYSLSICSVHSFAKVIDGIPACSPFMAQFFWLGFAFSMIDNVVYYQLALRLMSAALSKLLEYDPTENGELVEYLMSQRTMFHRHLKDFENFHGFEVTESSFDFVMMSVILKGIKIPFTSTASVEFAGNIFKLRYKCALKAARSKNEPVDLACFCYTIFHFLLEGSNEDVKPALEACGTEPEHSEMVTLTKGIDCPKVLLDLLKSEGDAGLITLYTGTLCFTSPRSDELLTSRYVHLLRFVATNNIKILWLVYPTAVYTVRGIVEQSTSMSAVEASLNVVNTLVRSPEYKELPLYGAEFDAQLEELKLTGFKSMEFSNPGAFDAKSQSMISVSDKLARAHYIKLILDRILSSYVEVG